MPPIPSQRDLFDIPNEIAYFNCAYNSPQLNKSRNRLLAGAAEKGHPWKRTAASFFADAETIRNLAASIFGGSADGYALIPAASYGLSAAARVVEPQLRTGDGILVVAEEFPSNVLPWRRVAQETGANLRSVPIPEDGDWAQAVLNAIDGRTKVVAASTCHWTNGARIDLQPVARACRSADIVLAVDATQTLGAMPMSIDQLQPDFLVAAGYKWLLCPYGFGLLHVSERWCGGRPLEETWLARRGAADFTALANCSDSYLPGARKFDVGEKCTPTVLPGAIAALEQIKAWGVGQIADTLSAINADIARHIAALGFQCLPESQRCSHILGASLPAGYAGNLVASLAAEDIYIGQRGNFLRFAPHLHINDRDVSRLLDALDRLVK